MPLNFNIHLFCGTLTYEGKTMTQTNKQKKQASYQTQLL